MASPAGVTWMSPERGVEQVVVDQADDAAAGHGHHAPAHGLRLGENPVHVAPEFQQLGGPAGRPSERGRGEPDHRDVVDQQLDLAVGPGGGVVHLVHQQPARALDRGRRPGGCAAAPA